MLALADFILTLPQTLISAFIAVKLLNAKKKWQFFFAFAAVNVLTHVIFGSLLQIPLPLKVAIGAIANFATLIIYSGEHLGKTLVYGTLAQATVVLSEAAFTAVYEYFSPLPFLEIYYTNPKMLVQMKIIYFFVFVIFMTTFALAWSRTVGRGVDHGLAPFAAFTICQCYLITVIQTLSISAHGADVRVYFILGTAVPLCIFADWLLFRTLRKLGQQHANEQRRILAESQLQTQLNYYHQLVANMDKVSRLRHDMNNQLQTAYIMLERGEHQRIRCQLDQLRDELAGTLPCQFCANQIVDAVLLEKSRQCQEAEIAFECTAEIDPNLGINEIHLCSIFANLMDNAICACQKVSGSNRSIHLQAGLEGGYLIIATQNGTEPQKSPKLSLKKQGQMPEHGLGLLILADIAAQYGGKVEHTAVDDVFSVTVWLKLSEKRQEENRHVETCFVR